MIYPNLIHGFLNQLSIVDKILNNNICNFIEVNIVFKNNL